MKLVSYIHAGRARFGAVKGDGVIDLTGKLGALDLRDLLVQDGVSAARTYARTADPDCLVSEVRFLPVIPNPGKILCVGLNYEGHRLETNSAKSDHPQIFARFADSLTAHEDVLVRPKVSGAFDYEGELAIVIGRAGRHVAEKDALSLVAGYACFNDGSVRDWQKHTTQFIPGKNFPRTGALGPVLTTADEIADPGKLTLTTRLNGAVVQQDSTQNLLFSVARIVSYCSAFTELQPGDIIPTGTPSGVGYRRDPPLFLQPGDIVEVEIEGVGLLRNHVRQEAA